MVTNPRGRRKFLQQAGAGWLALTAAQGQHTDKGKHTESAKKAKTAPARPSVTLNVRDFGAAGGGEKKDTAAIQQAIDRCSILGGGEVLVPEGNYLTGAIALRSNTLLRLDRAAVIRGTPDFADYPVSQVRWEGKWIPGHVGLFYAFDAGHFGIVGPGKIIGNPALSGRPNAQNPLRIRR
jgi:polygalacturonase